MAFERVLEMSLLAKDKATATFNKVSGSFSGLSALGGPLAAAFKGVTIAATAVSAAIVGVSAIMIKAAAAAEVQRLAVAKMELGLRNIGKFTPEASKEMQNFASSLQQVTVVGDEMILNGMSQLAMLGKLSGEGLKKATVATLDLSAAIGVDFNTASQLMAKAAAGNTSTLSRYGLVLETTGDKQKDFENLLTMIQERMGGSASLATDSFTGKVKQLKNAWGDAIEQLGQGVNESDRLQEVIQNLTEWIQKNGDAIVDFGNKIADVGATAIEFLIDKFLNVRKILGNFLLMLSKVADEMAGFADRMEKLGLVLGQPTTDAIAAAAKGMRSLSSSSAVAATNLFKAQDAVNAARDAAKQHTEAVKEERDEMLELAGFANATGDHMEEFAHRTETSMNKVSEATDQALTDTLATVDNFIPEITDSGTELGAGLITGMEEAIIAEQSSLNDTLQNTVDQVNKTMGGLITKVQTTQEGLQRGIAQIMRAAGPSAGGLVGSAPMTAQNIGELQKLQRIGLGIFAEGGVATKPTAGIFGEAGDEALIPLDRFGEFGTTVINNNITIPVGAMMGNDTDARLFAKRILDFLTEEQARRG